MATPPEEIERQHEQAKRLVGLPCAERINHGEIPLQYKQCPTCNAQQQQDFFPSWTSRGQVDVTLLQNLIREGYDSIPATPLQSKVDNSNNKSNGNKSNKSNNSNKPTTQLITKKRYTAADVSSPTNLWDPVNAAVNNVSICRPSHDAWGINKIVFIFCDDFLQTCHVFPWWWQRPDLKRAIQPILDTLSIDATRIVRLLLASLPPGVTIPVHHDSGEWVKYTHRVHVPILVPDPSQILFQCGFTNDTLQRIDCTQGHVFEINNQARHTVSNCSTHYRVHVILDYIDAVHNKPPIIHLQPGEVVLQTRRSMDRLQDYGQRPTPSFMILGAQKAGTTSLYEYIMQHPLAVRPIRRETHCLDWRWLDQATLQQQVAKCRAFFRHDQLQYHPSCITGDSTPSYLLDSRRVISRLQQVFEHWSGIKFLVMLREPIQRAESHYAMVTSRDGTPAQVQTRGTAWHNKTIQQVVQQDLDNLQQCGLLPHWDIEMGTCDQAVFDEFAGSASEDEAWNQYLTRHVPLNTGSYGLLARGLYELQLQSWLRVVDPSQFLVLQLEHLQHDCLSTTMLSVWEHLELPPIGVEDPSPKNTRDYDSVMDDDLKRYLQAFYQPYNQRLQQLLTRHGWASHGWSYDDANENQE